MNDRIHFAILGTGKRTDSLYAPLLKSLKADVELVGLWGRSEEKAHELGETYHVPWFTDLEHMRNDLDVNAAIVSVASPANGAVGRRVVDVVWCNPFRAYTIDDEMIAVKEFQYDRQLILQVMC